MLAKAAAAAQDRHRLPALRQTWSNALTFMVLIVLGVWAVLCGIFVPGCIGYHCVLLRMLLVLPPRALTRSS